jgi:hypothetical protein
MVLCRGLLLLIVLILCIPGCSGEAEKGINKNKERPVPPPADKADKADKN